ncbi:LytR/AlgR family response regulator transcription factor [Hanstruepera marina]|uniref:LytR/AlgR family response regulator transcription factor n=1 Tax=Hanstruepera marina TaxID=2873265 RepID=UPI001CA632EE|nr:LytTR family DNA-binding domain-containing protein [Hanstruepera marina]
MTVKTIIIDDEPLARQRIKILLNDVPEIEVIDECSTGKKAIKSIDTLNPDLIFLDIQLKDMTGFNILEKINPESKPMVIFITAYNDYALKAFDVFAFDYLQKPFKDDRFYKSTQKAIEQLNQQHNSSFEERVEDLLKYINSNDKNSLNNSKRIPIKLGNRVLFIENDNIKYIIASGYYAEIHTDERKHLLRESLNNLINDLQPEKFIRIHRSTIINLDYVKELIHSNYGEIDVKMTDNKLFRISRSYKKDFIKAIGLK